MKKTIIVLLGFVFHFQAAWAILPDRPTDAAHPGSASYAYGVSRDTLTINGRTVDIFMPTTNAGSTEKFSLIAFGHGQAIDAKGYEETFNHLAKKGIVVVHPSFDTGFFDQEWKRMADDFNQQVSAVVEKYADRIDTNRIVYAGHSKGAYVSLMALGAPSLARYGISPKAGVFFAPAGYDAAYLKQIQSAVPVTLFWSDQDTIIKKSLIKEIYDSLGVDHKQWISVTSYNEIKADHFFPLNKSYFFGGRNGISPYHFEGSWKWLIGAMEDVKKGSPIDNLYLYGREAGSSGITGIDHKIVKNW